MPNSKHVFATNRRRPMPVATTYRIHPLNVIIIPCHPHAASCQLLFHYRHTRLGRDWSSNDLDEFSLLGIGLSRDKRWTSVGQVCSFSCSAIGVLVATTVGHISTLATALLNSATPPKDSAACIDKSLSQRYMQIRRKICTRQEAPRPGFALHRFTVM